MHICRIENCFAYFAIPLTKKRKKLFCSKRILNMNYECNFVNENPELFSTSFCLTQKSPPSFPNFDDMCQKMQIAFKTKKTKKIIILSRLRGKVE